MVSGTVWPATFASRRSEDSLGRLQASRSAGESAAHKSLFRRR
jgi:hypothetical protein